MLAYSPKRHYISCTMSSICSISFVSRLAGILPAGLLLRLAR
jgi:hypothetical protein